MLAPSSVLKLKEACYSEIKASDYRTTRCYSLEDYILNSHHIENIKTVVRNIDVL
jgi:hypothetical protein